MYQDEPAKKEKLMMQDRMETCGGAKALSRARTMLSSRGDPFMSLVCRMPCECIMRACLCRRKAEGLKKLAAHQRSEGYFILNNI